MDIERLSPVTRQWSVGQRDTSARNVVLATPRNALQGHAVLTHFRCSHAGTKGWGMGGGLDGEGGGGREWPGVRETWRGGGGGEREWTGRGGGTCQVEAARVVSRVNASWSIGYAASYCTCAHSVVLLVTNAGNYGKGRVQCEPGGGGGSVCVGRERVL